MIIGMLSFFIAKGFMRCFKQKSGLALFVSVSVLLTFTMQVIGYAVANLGFQLVSPISLPLISQGNTATVINLILIGIMLSVFRTGDIVRDRHMAETANPRFVTWSDGKPTISFSKK